MEDPEQRPQLETELHPQARGVSGRSWCGRRCWWRSSALLALLLAITIAALVIWWVLRPAPPLNYSEDSSVRLAKLAGAAYCSVASLEAWSCGTKCISEVTKPVQVCPGETTQAFVGHMGDDCAVSFEGTKTYLSMLQDLRIAKDFSNWTGGNVHTGFLVEWESLQACIRTALTSHCARRSLVITGHSLGGAIASLAMVDLAKAGRDIKEAITFGMPRTGDATFARNFDRQFFGKFFRVTHHMDPVPHVPPQDFGFQHFSAEIFYDGEVKAGFRHCPDSEDLRCAGRYFNLAQDLFHISDHMDYMGQHTGSEGCVGLG